jgi:hypothetical protein
VRTHGLALAGLTAGESPGGLSALRGTPRYFPRSGCSKSDVSEAGFGASVTVIDVAPTAKGGRASDIAPLLRRQRSHHSGPRPQRASESELAAAAIRWWRSRAAGGGPELRRPSTHAKSGDSRKGEGPNHIDSALQNPGSVLLSHRLAPTVPSALESLTSVFGMGTGVTSPA